MASKRKLFSLSCEQKREICVYHGNNLCKTQQEIADLFSTRFARTVSRRTVGDILANKTNWLNRGSSLDVKRVRLGKNAELESALQFWFSSARSQNVVITDAVLREKAKQFGKDLAVENFQYSNGWLQRFKNRCGISSQVICGESAGVDVNIISRGREQAVAWIKDYAPKDVYNLDETGLFIGCCLTGR